MAENAKVMSVGACDIMARTPAGAAYVQKVTHPPTTIPQEYLGIPDSSAPNVVCMEVKGETNVAPIFTYATSSSATTTVNPSSMLFLSPSGGYVASYVFMQVPTTNGPGWSQPISWPSTANHPVVTNTTPPAVLNAGYNFSNWVSDVAMFRSSYKSETFYLNATDFNNQGTITTAKFKPNILRAQTVLTLFQTHSKCAGSMHSFTRAINLAIDPNMETFYVAKNELVGPVADYAVQVFECNGGTSANLRIPYSGTANEYSALYQFLPSSATDLLNLSSKSKTNPAVDGAFVVHQPVDPTSTWDVTTSLPDYSSGSSSIAAPVLSLIRAYNAGTGYQYFPLFTSTSGQGGNSANVAAVDTPWNNLDWSITILEGLTIPSSTGTTLSSVPYVTVKSYSGFEIQPQFGSSLRPFARLLPLPDRDAMDIATCIFHSRPDALPASANDLGTIAATLFKFTPMIIDGIKSMFGAYNKNKKQQAKERPAEKQAVASIVRKISKVAIAPKQRKQPQQQPRRRRDDVEPARKLPDNSVPKTMVFRKRR